MKTPGVYIVENSAFPNSVVEVATAVPAFIGYTAQADNDGSTLSKKPWRISSMSEFIKYFGGKPADKFRFAEFVAETAEAKAAREAIENAETPEQKKTRLETAPPTPVEVFKVGDKAYSLNRAADKTAPLVGDTSRYYLFYSMQLFFQNGGGPCYIVSVGSHNNAIDKGALELGIVALLKEQEPTMVVIPDAMALKPADCIALQQASLAHCNKMMNRFAILDISNGHRELTDKAGNCVADFRNALGINHLDYAAAYYPWLNTAILQTTDLGLDNFADLDALGALLLSDADAANTELVKVLQQVKGPVVADENAPEPTADEKAAADKLAKEALSPAELHKILFRVSPAYGKILLAMKNKLNLLPPAAAMAGVYTMVDNARGVWKAPANVSLASVVSPAVNITHDDQEDLNVTTAGKSINAIRAFIGEGTLVWGARTLDGNSLDWRYINVRRTMIMIEESLRLATKAYVFEPNVSGTWVTIRSMASNFLTSVWKRGGLAGASAEDAFSVSVGLGETMTPDDILEGILRVTILVAVSRPAEFIEITFQQQMQKS
jgi:phage tail sheath protein FI